METNEINQKPIKLDELLNERIDIERAEEKFKTDPENKDIFGPKIEKAPRRDRKTIVIVDYDFGKKNKNRNSISTLNHRALYLKNKTNKEADIWFLCSKGLYDLFLSGVKGKIDHVILGNYEKISVLEDIIRDLKKKGFDENEIIYQRARDFRKYIMDFSRKTGIKVDINRKEKNEVEYSRDVVDLEERADDKPKIGSIRNEEYPVNMVDIDEVIEDMEVEEGTNPKQIDINDLINTDKKRQNSYYL